MFKSSTIVGIEVETTVFSSAPRRPVTQSANIIVQNLKPLVIGEGLAIASSLPSSPRRPFSSPSWDSISTIMAERGCKNTAILCLRIRGDKVYQYSVASLYRPRVTHHVIWLLVENLCRVGIIQLSIDVVQYRSVSP